MCQSKISLLFRKESILILILINPLSVVGITINTLYTIDQLDYYIPYLPIISLLLILIDTNRIPIDLLEAESELIGYGQVYKGIEMVSMGSCNESNGVAYLIYDDVEWVVYVFNETGLIQMSDRERVCV